MAAYFLARTEIKRYTVCIEAMSAAQATRLAETRWGEAVSVEDSVEIVQVIE